MHGTNHYPTNTPPRDPMVHDLHTRVSRIEEGARHTQTEMAVIKNDMTYIKDNVGSLVGGVNRILWVIVLSVVAASTTFILSGGLAHYVP